MAADGRRKSGSPSGLKREGRAVWSAPLYKLLKPPTVRRGAFCRLRPIGCRRQYQSWCRAGEDAEGVLGDYGDRNRAALTAKMRFGERHPVY